MDEWYDEDLYDDFYGDEDQNDLMRIINSYIEPTDMPKPLDADDICMDVDGDELPF